MKERDENSRYAEHAGAVHTRTHGYNLKRIIGITKLLLFLIILCICFIKVNNILKRKESYEKTADFFAQKEDFDVLFFGSSHTMNAILPMELWNDYGIISYNNGVPGERMATTYYNLLLSNKETNPKLVVVDTFVVYSDEKISPKSEQVHKMLDVYPLSFTKYLAVKDLFDGKDILNKEFEYLFNFSMYNTRWNQLKENDFKCINEYEKGANSRAAIAKPNNLIDFEKVEMYSKEETVSMQYLRKIIEYCKENNIEILLTYLPFPAEELQISTSKYVNKIAEEYNVNYINFLNTNTINFDIDCYDKDSHLNQSGARKVTDYLGKYIMENYNISDQRNNEIYNFWNGDYNEYIDLKIKNLKENKKDLNNYLMLLYGEKDIKYEIIISSKRKIQENSTLKKVLNNIENNYQINDDTFVNKENKTVKITTWDNRTGKEIDTVWF